MNDKQFMAIWNSALDDPCARETFVSDWALSSIWCDSDNDDIPAERLDQIGKVWDAANRSIMEIAEAAGLSHRKLAERFGIPYRTVENWCSGNRTPPDYVLLMMQECLGLVRGS